MWLVITKDGKYAMLTNLGSLCLISTGNMVKVLVILKMVLF